MKLVSALETTRHEKNSISKWSTADDKQINQGKIVLGFLIALINPLLCLIHCSSNSTPWITKNWLKLEKYKVKYDVL